MNANCSVFSGCTQRMSPIYALRSRGGHCHCQVVTAAPWLHSSNCWCCCCPVPVGFAVLLLLLLLFRSGVFCALCSDVFITKAHEFYLARKSRSAPLFAKLMGIFLPIFSAPLTATCRQMPQREREDETGREPNTTKLCGQDYENCLHNTSA